MTNFFLEKSVQEKNVKTEVWFPRTSKNGGMFAVRASNQAIQRCNNESGAVLSIPVLLKWIQRCYSNFSKLFPAFPIEILPEWNIDIIVWSYLYRNVLLWHWNQS